MINMSEGKVDTFASPIQLPASPEQHADWQRRNKDWWESRPMTYDWDDEIGAEAGTEAFFNEVDRRCFDTIREYLPWHERPLDALIDYPALRQKDVLEVGVGLGTHAELIAPFAKSYTGIDLTSRASSLTARRLSLRGLAGRVMQMDAEAMEFPDASFDFIWSWGVIHHSANTLKILREMRRVLRPGGEAVVMVYHRSFWRYYVINGLFRGFALRRLWREGSVHGITQKATDGAIARFYRPEEWQELCAGLFEITETRVYGQPSQTLPLPSGLVKRAVIRSVPVPVWQFLNTTLKCGTFLVARMKRL